ncbi:MAG: hypothetical protein AAF383_28070 [Cyanobacteria bacterium P01_A01_bin.83]
MTDIHELLICIGSGLILLILISGFMGNNLAHIEVPLLGRVPLALLTAVAIPLYGCFGLIIVGLGYTVNQEFSLTVEIRLILGILAIITSYYFGKIMMQVFKEKPYQAFSDRALGLTAKIRFQPLQIEQSGDALIFDNQEKVTRIITIYLANWATEELKVNDLVRIIDYLDHKKAFVVIKTGGVDEFTWQNLLFHN